MATQLHVRETPDFEWPRVVAPAPTRRRILDAARDIIRRRGLPGLSMDGVARQTGFSRRTVYNHFEDRLTLFREVMLDLLQTLEEHIEIDLPPDVPLAAAVRRICAGSLAVMRAAEYDDVRNAIVQDGELQEWLDQAFARRIQRPLSFAIEHHLLERISGSASLIDGRQFCSSMLATLEAAAGSRSGQGSDEPFSVDEVANVMLARLGISGHADMPPLGPSVLAAKAPLTQRLV